MQSLLFIFCGPRSFWGSLNLFGTVKLISYVLRFNRKSINNSSPELNSPRPITRIRLEAWNRTENVKVIRVDWVPCWPESCIKLRSDYQWNLYSRATRESLLGHNQGKKRCSANPEATKVISCYSFWRSSSICELNGWVECRLVSSFFCCLSNTFSQIGNSLRLFSGPVSHPRGYSCQTVLDIMMIPFWRWEANKWNKFGQDLVAKLGSSFARHCGMSHSQAFLRAIQRKQYLLGKLLHQISLEILVKLGRILFSSEYNLWGSPFRDYSSGQFNPIPR